MQTIVAELRKAIADRKTANEIEEERLTKKLTLTRVKCFASRGRLRIYIRTAINHQILPFNRCVRECGATLKRNLLGEYV